MAKQTEEQILVRKWWVKLILAVIFVCLAYGFVSLAINSGSLWQYALGVIFLIIAAKLLVRSVRVLIRR